MNCSTRMLSNMHGVEHAIVQYACWIRTWIVDTCIDTCNDRTIIHIWTSKQITAVTLLFKYVKYYNAQSSQLIYLSPVDARRKGKVINLLYFLKLIYLTEAERPRSSTSTSYLICFLLKPHTCSSFCSPTWLHFKICNFQIKHQSSIIYELEKTKDFLKLIVNAYRYVFFHL